MQEIILNYYRTISDNIKKIRIDNNLSQEKFAEKLGCSREYISRLENYHEKPSLSMLLDICVIFDVSPEEFFRK